MAKEIELKIGDKVLTKQSDRPGSIKKIETRYVQIWGNVATFYTVSVYFPHLRDMGWKEYEAEFLRDEIDPYKAS